MDIELGAVSSGSTWNSGEMFLAYARQQHDLGVELAARHTLEATGCCRDCGRVYPCEGHERGLELAAHYQGWVILDRADPPKAL
jgi:hypothetical protein